MGHPHDYGVDADQLATPKPHDADVKKGGAPAPKQTPASSVETLKELVAETASAIKPLRGDVDHQFATADRIISTAAQQIASRMAVAKAALDRDQGDVGEITNLLAQLDAQLQILFVVARRHGVSLKGAHLDEVFDGEDALRQSAGLTALYHADNYYDDAAIAGSKPDSQTEDPTSDTLNSGEESAEKPQTRQQLIEQIKSFGTMVSNAMHSGLTAARDIISEPDVPKPPELLEVIADAALDFAINAATGMAGKLIKDMMKAGPEVAFESLTGDHKTDTKRAHKSGHKRVHKPEPKVHVGGEKEKEDEELGHAMIDVLADSLKDAGKGAIKPTIAVAHAPNEEEGKEGEGKEHEPDKKLSPKTLYFDVADNKTRSKMDATTANYSKAAHGKLLRMPVSALEALAGSFTEELKTRIKEETTSHIVDGWVVFGKKSGVYAGDPSKRPSESKLEAPYGICEIWMQATSPSAEHLQFTAAHLPYQTDAVLANVQQQKGSLADLPIERSIRVAGVALSPFYVDETGKIDAAVMKTMSADDLVTYANLASAGERKGGNLEAAALAGMYKVLHALQSIPRSRITEGWS